MEVKEVEGKNKENGYKDVEVKEVEGKNKVQIGDWDKLFMPNYYLKFYF